MKRLWLILFVVPLFAQNALILKRELVVNSSVSKQEQQDVLKLKSGGNYKGEYIKIESSDALFKPEGANGPQRIKINEVKMLKLSDGTEVIRGGRVKRKANETITIQAGDKIKVEYDTISKSVTGVFSGFDNGEISIQSFDKNQNSIQTIIPAQLVANIIVLPIKPAGAGVGGAVASCGIIMFVLSSLDGFDAEVGFVMAGLGAITGGLGGFVLDKIEDKRAFKDARYTLLGKDAWYIDNQDIK
jgi:hypothetical protein